MYTSVDIPSILPEMDDFIQMDGGHNEQRLLWRLVTSIIIFIIITI